MLVKLSFNTKIIYFYESRTPEHNYSSINMLKYFSFEFLGKRI